MVMSGVLGFVVSGLDYKVIGVVVSGVVVSVR